MAPGEERTSKPSSTSVLIVGGGPAGTAAAITCAQRGLTVTLLESKTFPRARPGETLHPGVTTLLRQLGVEEKVIAVAEIRHEGHWVKWGTREGFVPYGGDERGSWKGLQVSREVFDSILLDKARRIGAMLFQPCVVSNPIVERNRVVGVRSSAGDFRADWVINCAGANPWMERSLSQAHRCYSPRIFAHYGYCRGFAKAHSDCPMLTADSEGWIWTAQVARDLYNWTRVGFSQSRRRMPPPDLLAALASVGSSRAAEVTWRCSSVPAGPGYLVAGDAAAVLDPASSHGVLRALMSGIMGAHVISNIIAGAISESRGLACYQEWLHNWFLSDLEVLRSLYRELDSPPAWLEETFQIH